MREENLEEDEKSIAIGIIRLIYVLTNKNCKATENELLENLKLDYGSYTRSMNLLIELKIVSKVNEYYELRPKDSDNFLAEIITDLLRWFGPISPKDLADFTQLVVGNNYRETTIMALANEEASYKRFIRRRTVWVNRKKRDVYALVTQLDDVGKRVSMYNNPKLREQWRKKCEGEIRGEEICEEVSGGRVDKHMLEKAEEKPKSVDEFISHIKSLPWYKNQIVFIKDLDEKSESYDSIDNKLSKEINKILKQIDINDLYTHQCEAISTYLKGENFVVITPNASGKTLCYIIPILNEILKDNGSKFLYLAPIKALEQDQLRQLNQFSKFLQVEKLAAIYDGDTPQEQRKNIKKKFPNVILTNPDMLHYILAEHDKWRIFLSNLKIIVIDELHYYNGTFGSHVANIMRRLRMLCSLYGSEPLFICTSATIGNPKDFAEKLIAKKFRVLSKSGAPLGPKKFIFWNPFVNELADGARSPYPDAINLFKEHIKHKVKVILFARARKIAELIHQKAKSELEFDLHDKIATYRAGFLPDDRRKIERDLSNDNLIGVTATNALELGIDIGTLDGTILVGYPGTISSTWQQANRAGRRKDEAIVTLIGLDDPLNQYLMQNPNYIFDREPEHAVIDPNNKYILESHKKCLMYELDKFPDRVRGEVLTPERFPYVFDMLGEESIEDFFFTDVIAPHRGMSIRSISTDTYAIYDKINNKKFGTAEETRAFKELHEGAIYLHQGETYKVTQFDRDRKKIYVSPEEGGYYTETLRKTNISIKEVYKVKKIGKNSVEVGYGFVNVREDIMGYVEIDAQTGNVINKKDIFMPSLALDTTSVWIKVPDDIEDILSIDITGGLHAVEHTVIAMMPLIALCESRDLGGTSYKKHGNLRAPSFFVYDNCLGGIGLSEKGYERIDDLLKLSLETIKKCKCQEGCPMCIQSPYCGSRNKDLDKKSAITLLEYIVEGVETS